VIDDLIDEFLDAIALGTKFEDLTERETAGYWLNSSGYDALDALDKMLTTNEYEFQRVHFYLKVQEILEEALDEED